MMATAGEDIGGLDWLAVCNVCDISAGGLLAPEIMPAHRCPKCGGCDLHVEDADDFEGGK